MLIVIFRCVYQTNARVVCVANNWEWFSWAFFNDCFALIVLVESEFHMRVYKIETTKPYKYNRISSQNMDRMYILHADCKWGNRGVKPCRAHSIRISLGLNFINYNIY